MNSIQNSVYTTARQVMDLLIGHQTVVKDIAGLQVLQTEGSGLLSDISLLNDKLQVDPTVITAHKALLRVDAGAKVLDLSNKILAYATVEGDKVMAQKCSYSVTSLQKLVDNEFVSVCEQLMKLAQDNLMSLGAYKVTAESLADIRVSVKAFVTDIDKPKELRNELKQNTALLVSSFTALLTVLDKMDIMVEAAKNEYPDFYMLFQNTRYVNYRHGSLIAQGTVVDSKTGKAIEGAKLSFVLDGTEMLIKSSGASGGFRIKSMNEGSYAVTISKVGYLTQMVTVHVTDTDLTNIDVKLVHV